MKHMVDAMENALRARANVGLEHMLAKFQHIKKYLIQQLVKETFK